MHIVIYNRTDFSKAHSWLFTGNTQTLSLPMSPTLSLCLYISVCLSLSLSVSLAYAVSQNQTINKPENWFQVENSHYYNATHNTSWGG